MATGFLYVEIHSLNSRKKGNFMREIWVICGNSRNLTACSLFARQIVGGVQDGHFAVPIADQLQPVTVAFLAVYVADGQCAVYHVTERIELCVKKFPPGPHWVV